MCLKGRFVKDSVFQPENNFVDFHSHWHISSISKIQNIAHDLHSLSFEITSY